MAGRPNRARGAWLLGAALCTGCVEDLESAAGLVVGSGTAADSTGDDEHDASSDDGHATQGAGADDGGREDTATGDCEAGDCGDSGGTSDGVVPDATEAGRVLVQPGATQDAELVTTLAVGRTEEGAERAVVLRLDPDRLPDLLAGDRLVTPAEVQVTTRCDVGQTAPGCGYDPEIGAQIILTGGAGDVGANGPESTMLSDVHTQTCTKGEHHCMFVFRPDDASNVIEGALELPCVAAGACHVNLVMWAWDPNARPDGQDVVLVGGNEGNYLVNGIVESDRARLMAIRERAIAATDRHTLETTGGGAKSVPTDASPVLVYSHALKAADDALRRDEQFVVEAKVVASVDGRARFSTEMFLTEDPGATDGSGIDGVTPGQIGEHNGINCTPGQSPCITRKVAVFRVDDDIQAQVYVNVVVKSAVPGGGSANVTVHRNAGWLRAARYEAQHEG